ncbi:MAG TPA: glycosyltransferase family 87 protein [Terriglobia bacterium]|nr:glycosyltransferase family 87 protein [Terriglobia bacterium]
MVQSGQGSQLYNIAAQGRFQAELFPNVTTRSGTLIFLHPPFEALPYLPLAYVPYPTAYAICAIVNILLLLLTVVLLSPYLKELGALWRPLPLLMFLGFFPVFVDLLQGQDSIWLLFIFALTFDSLKKGRALRGGIFLGLGLFKFQYTLPFLIPVVLWRWWKVMAGLAISAAMMFLLSLPVAGFQGTLSYAPFLLDLTRKLSTSNTVQNAAGIVSDTMPNIHGIVEMLIPNVPFPGIQKPLIVLLSGLAVLWLARQWPLGRSLSAKTIDLGFSLAIITSILVSYHLLLHDLSLLLIPFILVLNGILKGEICAGRRRAVAFGIITLFYLSPLYLLLMGHGRMYLFFWPILAFFVLLSWELVDLAKGREPAGRENLPGPIADAT